MYVDDVDLSVSHYFNIGQSMEKNLSDITFQLYMCVHDDKTFQMRLCLVNMDASHIIFSGFLIVFTFKV